MRAVLRLDHDRGVPEQLLVRNHSGPASIARVHIIRTWLDANPMPDFSHYMFGPTPAPHTPPDYHPVGNPPTQMPANLQNLVATVLEREIPSDTPNLRPVHTMRETPHPNANNTNASAYITQRQPGILALPWYGVGGVPERSSTVEEDTATAMADLSLDVPTMFSAAGHTEGEHESRAQKRRARRKRAKDSAHKLRRSMRLKEKEEANFEPPEEKAARVQQAKFDFTGASRRLRNALSRSYLLSDIYYPSCDDESLTDIAAACGASEDEIAGISGVTALPSTDQ
jgi:hypothetical protein